MDALSPIAFITYLCAPAVAVILVSLQLWRLGRRPLSCGLLVLSIVWGVFNILNPFIILWLPDFLSAAYQDTYLLMRSALLFAFAGFAIHSVFTRSERTHWTSIALLAALMIDVLGAYFGGTYVGP